MAGRMMANNAALKGLKEAKKKENVQNAAEKEKADAIAAVDDVDVDDLSEYIDPDNYDNPYVKKYIVLAQQANKLAYGEWSGNFDAFIISVIIMAGAMVGIQTYPDYSCPAPVNQNAEWKATYVNPEHPNHPEHKDIGYCHRHADAWLSGDGVIDKFVFWTFVSELLIKICANGAAPWNYWLGPEKSWNNFDFVIVMLSIQWVAGLLFGSGGGGNLMILRLFRLARLLKLVGKIKKLQSIVMGLVAGIKAAGYIAMLLFLVFYIFAIAGMLAFQKNDPFHFRSIPSALNSLFRAATMEDWTDIMYINIFGCDKFGSGQYYTRETFEGNNFYDTWDELPNIFKCNHPVAQPALSPFFWILFIFCASFVMLALFVGSITIAMSEQMDLAEEGDEDAEAEEAEHHASLVPRAAELSNKFKAVWNKYARATEPCDRLMPLENELATYRFGAYSRFAEMNQKFADNEHFQTFVTCTILAAGITVGIDTEMDGAASPDAKRPLDVFLWYADTVINWIFTVEVSLKLIGQDWHPWRYFNDNWNKFDFVIVSTSWLPVVLAAGGNDGGSGLGALKLLRLLRLFRIMRVIKKLPELTVIVDALLVGMESIGFIALIIFVVYYLFAVGGMMLFSTNDPYHFGKLHRALLTLFRVATFEDWTDVMYINVYGCSRWGYNDDGQLPRSSSCHKLEYTNKDTPGIIVFARTMFFICFIFLGAFCLLTLFVGVVTTSMEEAQAKQRNIMGGEKDIGEYFAGYGIPSEATIDIMECFDIIDSNGDGEVTLVEFMAACKVITEFNEEEHPPRLLLADANFCSDGTGGEVPEKGNPAVLMKYILNYMARCAGSEARFTYQVENSEAEAELARMAEAELAKKRADAAKRRPSKEKAKEKAKAPKAGESTL